MVCEKSASEFRYKTRIIFRMLWGSDPASCISISGYKVELVFHEGRRAVGPRVPRVCSLHPQSVWRPHRIKPCLTLELALFYTLPFYFPSLLHCPVAGGPWVMCRRRHKPNFCWFWMQLWTRYCCENTDIFFSGISILLIQNNFSQIFLLI